MISGALALERICQFLMANNSLVNKAKRLKIEELPKLKKFFYLLMLKDHFNVVRLVTWRLNKSEAGTICTNAMTTIACISRHNSSTPSERSP